MANKNKAIGTAWETTIVKFVKTFGLNAERIALSGSDDCGDVVIYDKGWDGWVVEAKAVKSFHRKNIEEWRLQAIAEAENYEKKTGRKMDPLLITKQSGQAPANAIVHFYVDGEWGMCFMDEFFSE